MSPRKSSTSSGRPPHRRPRYLGLEVAGEHLPALSPRAWESLLLDRLVRVSPPPLRFRLIRSDGQRAIVEVEHLEARRARAAWTVTSSGPNAVALRPYRTWGTLVRAKAWLRQGSRLPSAEQ